MLFRLPLNLSNHTRAVAALALVFGLALIFGPGCKHRRSALRPVFVDPAPVMVEPGLEVSPAVPVDPYQPGEVITPGFEDSASGFSSPVAPPAYEFESPSTPRSNEEPEFIPPQDSETVPSSVNPELTPPQSRRVDPSDRAAAPTRSAALRARIEALADDPIDLIQPPKADRPWQFVVLHHSATPTGSHSHLDRAHREAAGLTSCGYHFVIGNGTESPDGQIEVTSRWSDQKAGAACPDVALSEANEYGISICLIGDLNGSPPTPRQVETTRTLIAYLQDRYTIPSQRVATHAELAAFRNACPGRQFPAEAILARKSLAQRD